MGVKHVGGVAMDDGARGAGGMAVDISMWVASGPRQVTQRVPCLVTRVTWIMFFLENEMACGHFRAI